MNTRSIFWASFSDTLGLIMSLGTPLYMWAFWVTRNETSTIIIMMTCCAMMYTLTFFTCLSNIRKMRAKFSLQSKKLAAEIIAEEWYKHNSHLNGDVLIETFNTWLDTPLPGLGDTPYEWINKGNKADRIVELLNHPSGKTGAERYFAKRAAEDPEYKQAYDNATADIIQILD